MILFNVGVGVLTGLLITGTAFASEHIPIRRSAISIEYVLPTSGLARLEVADNALAVSIAGVPIHIDNSWFTDIPGIELLSADLMVDSDNSSVLYVVMGCGWDIDGISGLAVLEIRDGAVRKRTSDRCVMHSPPPYNKSLERAR